MALIEVFHVVASNLPVDTVNTTDIPQGMLLMMGTDGNVAPCNGDSTTQLPLGVAGDARSAGTTSYTAESGAALSRNPTVSLEGGLVTGAWGQAQRFTQNRVADNYNEVLASGKMTVYHSGGEFWTDQYELTSSGGAALNVFTPGLALFASGTEVAGTALGEAEAAAVGRFTPEVSTAITTNPGYAIFVGVILNGPEDYPSGVPGTDTAFSALPEGGNSLSWGQFLHVKLCI